MYIHTYPFAGGIAQGNGRRCESFREVKKAKQKERNQRTIIQGSKQTDRQRLLPLCHVLQMVVMLFSFCYSQVLFLFLLLLLLPPPPSFTTATPSHPLSSHEVLPQIPRCCTFQGSISDTLPWACPLLHGRLLQFGITLQI